jgi:hypothetical protein
MSGPRTMIIGFTADAIFVLLGRSSNGREFWKDASGRTLKENQTAEVESNP